MIWLVAAVLTIWFLIAAVILVFLCAASARFHRDNPLHEQPIRKKFEGDSPVFSERGRSSLPYSPPQ